MVGIVQKSNKVTTLMTRTIVALVRPDAPHAFFADYRPSYREKEAKDGWQRLQAWFKRHGV
jgi:carboxymethylenebutenolidase